MKCSELNFTYFSAQFSRVAPGIVAARWQDTRPPLVALCVCVCRQDYFFEQGLKRGCTCTVLPRERAALKKDKDR